MSVLTVVNPRGEAVGQVEFPDALLVKGVGRQALQQTVVTLQANKRAGTHSTKTKGEVAGSGIKPWRQKGTGNARAGYKQSPIWRGGGVVFGPKPRSYAKGLNRKTAQLALRRALTEKLAESQVHVVDAFSLEAPRTKQVAALLKSLNVDSGVLLVAAALDKTLLLASRNMPKVELVTAADVNALQVVRYPALVISKDALAKLQERLSGGVEAVS